MKRIIFTNSDEELSIIIPAPDCSLTIEQIALKDVPSGVPYKIVDTSDIPTDRADRNAWEADMSDPDGYGADYGTGSANNVVGWTVEGEPITKLS
jgi:hypothetical protein